MINERLVSLLLASAVLLAILVFGGWSSRHREVEASASSRPTKTSMTNTTTGRPYWKRPGCHQVGHTRTISIPGCVKFNLSLNACRGYCMSFSIPAPDDIGPGTAPPPPEDGPADGSSRGLSSVDSRLLMLLADGGPDYVTDLRQPPPDPSAANDMRKKSSPTADLAMLQLIDQRQRQQQQPHQAASNKQPDTFWRPGGQTRSPLAGAVGDTDNKRDLVSVGQCCNMIETERVTVNLRCGHNETRRLVFNSAKTCECFFCKHV